MFCKISQKSGLEYIREELYKEPTFAAIASEPYDIRCYQFIDTIYSFLSPYRGITNELKRVQQVSTNLFGKQRFDLYKIENKKVIWIPVFKKAVERYREIQIDEDVLFEEYYVMKEKVSQLNEQLRTMEVATDEHVESISLIMKTLTLANTTIEALELQIYPFLKEKKMRVAGDKPLSWKERRYLAEDQQTVGGETLVETPVVVDDDIDIFN